MTAAIVAQPTPAPTAAVIAYLQAQGERVTPLIVEAMSAELEQVARLTNDSDFTASEYRYAYMIAHDEPIGFDDMPASLLP